MPTPTPASCAGWLTIAASSLAVVAGALTLCFTVKTGHCFSTLVALAMTVFWGTMSVTLVVSASSAKRIQSEMRKQTVEHVLEHLVSGLDATNNEANAKERAELVDRIHALASTALGKP